MERFDIKGKEDHVMKGRPAEPVSFTRCHVSTTTLVCLMHPFIYPTTMDAMGIETDENIFHFFGPLFLFNLFCSTFFGHLFWTNFFEKQAQCAIYTAAMNYVFEVEKGLDSEEGWKAVERYSKIQNQDLLDLVLLTRTPVSSECWW